VISLQLGYFGRSYGGLFVPERRHSIAPLSSSGAACDLDRFPGEPLETSAALHS
jgi:hypothetical protein